MQDSSILRFGLIGLPSQYKKYLDLENSSHMAIKGANPSQWNLWEEHWLPDKSLPPSSSNHSRYLSVSGEKKEVRKPSMSEDLSKRISRHLPGRQEHYAMTLVSSVLHTDDFNGQLDMLLLIPHIVSTHHYLVTQSDEVQLEPGYGYAFNQRLKHGLEFRAEGLKRQDRTSATFIAVCFYPS